MSEVTSSAPSVAIDPNAVGNAALTTAEQLLPLVIDAISAGSAATNVQDSMIAMVATMLPTLIQSFGMQSSQLQRLLSVTYAKIQENQAAMDAVAAARGIVVPTPVPIP